MSLELTTFSSHRRGLWDHAMFVPISCSYFLIVGMIIGATPTEQQFYDVCRSCLDVFDDSLLMVDQKLSPELKRKVDSARAQREQGTSMKERLAVSARFCIDNSHDEAGLRFCFSDSTAFLHAFIPLLPYGDPSITTASSSLLNMPPFWELT